MRIDIRNLARQRLFSVDVDANKPPPKVHAPKETDMEGSEIYLHWDQALDDEGHLRRCPVCGCRELFVRRDFPQVTGLVVVVLAVVISLVLFSQQEVAKAFVVLGAMVGIDLLILLFTGRCLVCYRCRSEFRNLPIPDDHPHWDLAVGEKYRQATGSSSKSGEKEGSIHE